MVGVVLVPASPNSPTSEILAQLFCVLPLTVILTYLPCVSVTSYFSAVVDVPVLLPEKTLVKVVPSFETAMSNVFTL